jgi:hypothetical protein
VGEKLSKSTDDACITVDPGVCGFTCVIRAHHVEKRSVAIEITESECQQINQLAGRLETVSLKGLFMPLTRNPVYRAAEASGCHASCAIPSAVLKAAEVAMGMALARPVRFSFDPDKEDALGESLGACVERSALQE